MSETKITPAEMTKKARQKTYNNLLEKIRQGKAATKAELNLMDELADEFEDKPVSGMVTLTTAQCCLIFDVDKQTISDWKGIGARPFYIGINKWDFRGLLHWWLSTMYRAGDNPDIAAEKLRLTRAQANREEMRVDREGGKLVMADHVNNAAFETWRKVRDQIQSVPDRVAPLLIAESDLFKCKMLLKTEINYILEGLSEAVKWQDEMPDVEANKPGPKGKTGPRKKPGPKPKKKPVKKKA